MGSREGEGRRDIEEIEHCSSQPTHGGLLRALGESTCYKTLCHSNGGRNKMYNVIGDGHPWIFNDLWEGGKEIVNCTG